MGGAGFTQTRHNKKHPSTSQPAQATNESVDNLDVLSTQDSSS